MRLARRLHLKATLAAVRPHLPSPWDIDVLVDALAKHRRRPIALVAWELPDGGPSGMWIPTGTADYIVYRRSATATAREVTIGHELGHLLLDHNPRLSQAPAELLAALVPSITSELADRFLTRTGYQNEQEAEAEEFGTRLALLGSSARARSGPDELGRLTDSLG